MTKKAEVLELIKITPCKRHAWYRCFLPKQKTEVIIKKEYKTKIDSNNFNFIIIFGKFRNLRR